MTVRLIIRTMLQICLHKRHWKVLVPPYCLYFFTSIVCFTTTVLCITIVIYIICPCVIISSCVWVSVCVRACVHVYCCILSLCFKLCILVWVLVSVCVMERAKHSFPLCPILYHVLWWVQNMFKPNIFYFKTH